MKFFSVIYYYYYLFDKMFTDEDLQVWAALHLGFFEGLLVNYFFDLFLSRYYQIIPPVYVSLAVAGFIVALNLWYFVITDRYKVIINDKPKLFSSHWFSAVITILFTACIVGLYWFE